MPSLRTLCLRHSRLFADRLRAIDARFQEGGDGLAPSLREFDDAWGQIQAGQKWAALHAADAAAAFVCSSYAALCAEADGASILEVRLPYPVRIAWLRAGVSASQGVRDSRAEVVHLYNLGLALLASQQLHEGRSCVRRARRMFHATGDRFEESAALNALGLACRAMRTPRRSAVLHLRALALCRELGSIRDQAFTLGSLAGAFLQAGSPDRALRTYEEALALHRSIGDQSGEFDSLQSIGAILLQQGCRERAARMLREALDALNRLKGVKNYGFFGARLAALLFLAEDPDATELAEAAVRDARALGHDVAEAFNLFLLGLGRSAIGDIAGAVGRYGEALSAFRRADFHVGQGLVLRRLGDHYAEQGDPSAAEDYHGQALAIFERLGYRPGIEGVRRSPGGTPRGGERGASRDLASDSTGQGSTQADTIPAPEA